MAPGLIVGPLYISISVRIISNILCLYRGEQTAQAIENHLTRIEQEIDRLLGSVEAEKEDGDEVAKDDDKEKHEKKQEEENGSDEKQKGDKQ